MLSFVNDYIVWYARDLESIRYRTFFRATELGGAVQAMHAFDFGSKAQAAGVFPMGPGTSKR